MKIEFTESRQLISGETVAVGDERDLPEADALAYVNNGIARAVTSASPAAATPTEEVISNG